MSDEPSVAEIIGWRLETADRGYSYQWMMSNGMFTTKPEPTVDDMLAWLRAQYPNQIKVGLQDDLVGFPAHLPAGFWVEVPTGSTHTSFCSTTLVEACQYAVRAVAADLNSVAASD